MTHRLRIVNGAAEFAHCCAIRARVFIEEQGVPAADEWDEHDATATHFLIFNSTSVVGTARLRLLPPRAKIERVAVLQAARGQGMGTALMRFVMDYASRQPGVSEAYVSAQLNARAFYRGLGFVASGDEYLEVGIAHQSMQRALP